MGRSGLSSWAGVQTLRDRHRQGDDDPLHLRNRRVHQAEGQGRVGLALFQAVRLPGLIIWLVPAHDRNRPMPVALPCGVVGRLQLGARRIFFGRSRNPFPVGIDAPNGRLLPQTMRAYGMEGTPTTLLIDRKGGLRRQVLGHIPDLQLGAEIMQLIAGKGPEISQNVTRSDTCSPDGCA